MGRRKVSIEKTDGVTMISGTAEDIMDVFDRATERVTRKAIDIRAAELKDQMFCKFKYLHTIGPNTVNKVATDSELPVHPDLVAGFRRLDNHLAVICEEVDPAAIENINVVDPGDPVADKLRLFMVTSFRLDGNDDATSVVLVGTKELSTGELIKLETPKIVMDDSYPFAHELSSTIHDLIYEVEEYMKGKQADNPQQVLPFDENESEGGE